MSVFHSLGLGIPRLTPPASDRPPPAPPPPPPPPPPRQELVHAQRPLRRVMAFLGSPIDQVGPDPIVKTQVFASFKLYKKTNRHSEIRDLERQWNSAGVRY